MPSIIFLETPEFCTVGDITDGWIKKNGSSIRPTHSLKKIINLHLVNT